MGKQLEFLYGIASAEPSPIMTDFTVDCGCYMEKVEGSKQSTYLYSNSIPTSVLFFACTWFTNWSKNLLISPNCKKNHLMQTNIELDEVRFFNEHVNGAQFKYRVF